MNAKQKLKLQTWVGYLLTECGFYDSAIEYYQDEEKWVGHESQYFIDGQKTINLVRISVN
jgi:hypothetical protein